MWGLGGIPCSTFIYENTRGIPNVRVCSVPTPMSIVSANQNRVNKLNVLGPLTHMHTKPTWGQQSGTSICSHMVTWLVKNDETLNHLIPFTVCDNDNQNQKEAALLVVWPVLISNWQQLWKLDRFQEKKWIQNWQISISLRCTKINNWQPVSLNKRKEPQSQPVDATVRYHK